MADCGKAAYGAVGLLGLRLLDLARCRVSDPGRGHAGAAGLAGRQPPGRAYDLAGISPLLFNSPSFSEPVRRGRPVPHTPGRRSSAGWRLCSFLPCTIAWGTAAGAGGGGPLGLCADGRLRRPAGAWLWPRAAPGVGLAGHAQPVLGQAGPTGAGAAAGNRRRASSGPRWLVWAAIALGKFLAAGPSHCTVLLIGIVAAS